MGLFTLTDIKFDSKARTRSGDLGVAPEYTSNILKYPIDIGAVDKGHYMIFHINVQDKTDYSVRVASNPDSKVQADRKRLQNRTGAVNISGNIQNVIEAIPQKTIGSAEVVGAALLDKLKSISSNPAYNAIIGTTTNIGKNTLNDLAALDNAKFLRTTKRTTDSVALYMPNTLNFTQAQGFSGLELGNELLNLPASILQVIANKGDVGKNLTPFVQEAITGLIGGNTSKAIFASLAGVTKNPRMEMIYTGPGDFRTFRFSFMFYPRSAIEAREVQAIIARFNFHQVPEIKKGTAGYFLVPPSEFDIDFYYNGSVNPNIPEITTCVLEAVDVDYAPNGFQAFEVDDTGVMVGGTGMPVGIRMDLSFKETAIMTKLDFADKRGTGNMVTVSTNKIGAQ